jgi:radical SAM protein with 4Fe4S-binding SPASM domain
MIIKKNKRTKKLHKAISLNLKRRTIIVDDIMSKNKNIPIPSWIELSIIDVCNRSCTFCPKSDHSIAPDTYQKMSQLLIDKLCKDLKEINYKGSVTMCGYGEPLLHKEVSEIARKLAKVSFVEIVTNGDTLKAKTIKDLYNANTNKLLISMYDGPEQVEKFQNMIKQSGVPSDFVILRDRWYDATKDYGIKLTNRTGTIKVGEQVENNFYTKCFYPSYQFLIDWNGDVFLCPQDWQRRVTMGNIMQETVFNIWKGPIMTKYRKKLLMGDRSLNPCNKCNAEGTLLGKNHAVEWNKIYKQS